MHVRIGLALFRRFVVRAWIWGRGVGLFLVLLGCFRVEAGVLLAERFPYPDGPLVQGSAGLWRTHSGKTNELVVTNHQARLYPSRTEDVNTLIPGQPFGTNASAGWQYIRFKVQLGTSPGTNGAYFLHLKDHGSGFRARVWAVSNAVTASIRLGLSNGSAAPTVLHPTSVGMGEVHRVVLGYGLGTGEAKLWLDPVQPTDPGVEIPLSDRSTPVAVTALALRQNSGSGQIAIWDLMVATSFEEVFEGGAGVPGPTDPSGTAVTPPVAQPPVNGAGNPVGDPGVINPPVVQVEVPTLTRDLPATVQVEVGDRFEFAVSATGGGTLEYQWFHNGSVVAGRSGPAWVLGSASMSDAGSYLVRVVNPSGVATSQVLNLVVVPRPTSIPTGGGGPGTPVTDPGPAQPPAAALGPAPEVGFVNELGLLRSGDQITNRFTELSLVPGEWVTTRVWVTNAPGVGSAVSPALRSGGDGVPVTASWEFRPVVEGVVEAILRFRAIEADRGNWIRFRLEAFHPGGMTNAATLSVYVPTALEEGVELTEILVNPSGSPSSVLFNPLKRAVPSTSYSTDDEFVELVNFTGLHQDLGGWTLEDSVRVRHRFAAPMVVGPSNAVVIAGRVLGALPLDGGVMVEASDGVGLSLNNGGDVVVLRNADGRLISRVVYGGGMSQGSLQRTNGWRSGFGVVRIPGWAAVTAGLRPDGRIWSDASAFRLGDSLVGPAGVRLRVDFDPVQGTVGFDPGLMSGVPFDLQAAVDPEGPFETVWSGLAGSGSTPRLSVDSPRRFYRVKVP